jgi:hypothetical protein
VNINQNLRYPLKSKLKLMQSLLSNDATNSFLRRLSTKSSLTSSAVTFLSSTRLKIPTKYRSTQTNSLISPFKAQKCTPQCTLTQNKRSISTSCSSSSSIRSSCSNNTINNNSSRCSWRNINNITICKTSMTSKKMKASGTNISTNNKTTEKM